MFSILSSIITKSTINSCPRQHFYFTCPQCNSFCMLKTCFSCPAGINVSCDCGLNKNLFLSDYLEQMKNNHKPVLNLCKKHKYQTFISFCLTCKSHLCKTCIESNVHQSHSIESLSINQNYLLKKYLITVSETIESFRTHLSTLEERFGKQGKNRP